MYAYAYREGVSHSTHIHTYCVTYTCMQRVCACADTEFVRARANACVPSGRRERAERKRERRERKKLENGVYTWEGTTRFMNTESGSAAFAPGVERGWVGACVGACTRASECQDVACKGPADIRAATMQQ